MEEESRMERLATAASNGTIDIEKGSIALESRRLSRDSVMTSAREKEEEKRPPTKAVVRVEVHDTGVGLRKSDIIE
jgi:hypothetical protein